MKLTSVVVMVDFFSEVSFQNYLITAMFNVLYQQLQGTLTVAFETHLTIEDFLQLRILRAWVSSLSQDI